MPGYSFKKGERLSSRKTITSLFQSGRVVISHPVRIIYQFSEEGDYPAMMAVSVPKRTFKRAVDRNLLKRRIREIYRLSKPQFYSRLEKAGMKIHLVIQYQQSGIEEFGLLEKGIRKGLEKVTADLTG
jgi:ribonuclease P protein component